MVLNEFSNSEMISEAVDKVMSICKNHSIDPYAMKEHSKKIDLFQNIIPLINENASLKEIKFKKWNSVTDGYGYIKKDEDKIELAVPERYEMCDSSEESNREQNFNIAHEIGHLMLHVQNDSLKLNRGPYTEAQSSYAYRATFEIEKEAETFAYKLLAPKKILQALTSHLPTIGVSDTDGIHFVIAKALNIPIDKVETACKLYNLDETE
jgi:Zn-dependent peptidase ImmA (M78 family)